MISPERWQVEISRSLLSIGLGNAHSASRASFSSAALSLNHDNYPFSCAPPEPSKEVPLNPIGDILARR